MPDRHIPKGHVSNEKCETCDTTPPGRGTMPIQMAKIEKKRRGKQRMMDDFKSPSTIQHEDKG